MAATKDVVPTPSRGRKLTLSFGMVSVPVYYKPFTDSVRPVPGTGMCKTHGAALEQVSRCCTGTADEHLVENADKQYGYPHPDQPDRLVVVERETFKALEERTDGRGTIEAVVDVAAIDPCFFGATYLLWPQRGGEEAFDLLAAVLDAQGKAAVVSCVLSKQQQKVVLRFSHELGCVLAHAITYTERLRTYEAKLVRDGAKQREAVDSKALAMAGLLFAALEGEFDAAEVEDRLTLLKQEAIRAAAAGQVYTPRPEAAATLPAIDLMAALQASMAAAKKKPARKKPASNGKVAAA